jgi:predicted alpha/beta hydrolase
MSLYENAQVEVQRIAPADLSVRRIGHFGPFRSEHEACCGRVSSNGWRACCRGPVA